MDPMIVYGGATVACMGEHNRAQQPLVRDPADTAVLTRRWLATGTFQYVYSTLLSMEAG